MSAEVQTAPKVSLIDRQPAVVQRRNNDQRAQQQNRRPNINNNKEQQQVPYQKNKNKYGEIDGGGGGGGRHFKSCRKRSQSFSAGSGKFFPPYKRRKKDAHIIPPTKFLLGGNICDPLNLNSLQDEDINRAMNAVTPKSSPLPTPKHRKGFIEVIIPRNYNDPLNLADVEDDEEYEMLIKRSQKLKKNKKKRKHPNKSGPGSGKEDSGIEEAAGLGFDEKRPNEGETAVPTASDSAETMEVARLTRNKEPNLTLDLNVGEEEGTGTLETLHSQPQQQQQGHQNQQGQAGSFREPLKRENSGSGISAASCAVTGGAGAVSGFVKKFKKDLKDKIVSPVIPQPGAWSVTSKLHRYRLPQRLTPQIDKNQATPKFKENNTRFKYGNYNRYYGYRNPNQDCDLRLKVLAKRKDLFHGKDILDIGCNVGHVTLAIARDFTPSKVVGVDIDRSLIEVARRNVRHYADRKSNQFPASMSIVYGALDVPSTNGDNNPFPHNVSFVQGNYVLESDILLSMEQPQFDTILCLSITKWFQLNWGDAGLKRAFKRMYAQLRPGGVLILEPQPWHSYKKKRNLTPEIWKNYTEIELFPHKFSQYLLSEVGFTKCEVLGAPLHYSKGFQRPIKIFTKGELSSTASSVRIENVSSAAGIAPAPPASGSGSEVGRGGLLDTIPETMEEEEDGSAAAAACERVLDSEDVPVAPSLETVDGEGKRAQKAEEVVVAVVSEPAAISAPPENTDDHKDAEEKSVAEIEERQARPIEVQQQKKSHAKRKKTKV